MKKIDIIAEDGTIVKEIVHGLGTDAGGGGTREGLALELSKLGRTCSLALFLTITCTMHGSNRMMQSPCQKYFGDGSVKARNLIQLLYTCYVLQDTYEIDEFRFT